jgi:hypothetical protein
VDVVGNEDKEGGSHYAGSPRAEEKPLVVSRLSGWKGCRKTRNYGSARFIRKYRPLSAVLHSLTRSWAVEIARTALLGEARSC